MLQINELWRYLLSTDCYLFLNCCFNDNLFHSAQPSESNGPSRHGLSMWRLLSEPPFYDFVPPYDQLSPGASPSRFFLATYLYSSAKSQKQDYVYLLEMSPNGKEICAVHASGAISVWQIPSMRPSVTLPLEDQPSYDDLNPSLLQNPKARKIT